MGGIEPARLAEFDFNISIYIHNLIADALQFGVLEPSSREPTQGQEIIAVAEELCLAIGRFDPDANERGLLGNRALERFPFFVV